MRSLSGGGAVVARSQYNTRTGNCSRRRTCGVQQLSCCCKSSGKLDLSSRLQLKLERWPKRLHEEAYATLLYTVMLHSSTVVYAPAVREERASCQITASIEENEATACVQQYPWSVVCGVSPQNDSTRDRGNRYEL